MNTTAALNEPVDPVHAEALAARDWIRAYIKARRLEVAAWEPRPTPDNVETSSD